MTTNVPGSQRAQQPRGSAPAPSAQRPADASGSYVARAEASLAEKFKGVTTDGQVAPGLFSIQKTGVSTQPIKDAAEAFLTSLSAQQREATLFPVDADEWRRWSNIHRTFMRHGLSVVEMNPAQRDQAFALLKAGLSLKGFETARDIMRLNGVVADMTGRHDEFSEELYWLSIMGTPSEDEPWGWQMDGHHLIINCFPLRDQIVMTPMFMGSEPVLAEDGKYAGTRVFQAEERGGLALIRALTAEQQHRTILSSEFPTDVFTTAFRDSFELHYEGVCYDELSSAQQSLLSSLIENYIGRTRPGHAQVKMHEVEEHLSETYFAWMGGFGSLLNEETVFYYRVHSPVMLIEFDHQRGVALGNDKPSRNHIHTVVRTPNGNDYGKDLLRQHHMQFGH